MSVATVTSQLFTYSVTDLVKQGVAMTAQTFLTWQSSLFEGTHGPLMSHIHDTVCDKPLTGYNKTIDKKAYSRSVERFQCFLKSG